MSLQQNRIEQVLPDWAQFDLIIDARSPAEFALDHLPGAVNWPVLDDEQRRIVGTLYKQTSALEARKLGAAMAARNIADHLDREMPPLTRDWRPLVYCWRGGQRSGSLSLVLSQIGYRVTQLAGGYKGFRAQVRLDLDDWAPKLKLRVLCGRTGSGKTRILQALAEQGAQVLDLESLANHRGSVLGDVPEQPQPSQKQFETLLWQAVRGFDLGRSIWIESESRKIGNLRVPEALHNHLRAHGNCVWIDTPLATRVQLLLQDYEHFRLDPQALCTQLDKLVPLRGRDVVATWQDHIRKGEWTALLESLLRDHYDPGYERSLEQSFPQLASAPKLALAQASLAQASNLAQNLLINEPDWISNLGWS